MTREIAAPIHYVDKNELDRATHSLKSNIEAHLKYHPQFRVAMRRLGIREDSKILIHKNDEQYNILFSFAKEADTVIITRTLRGVDGPHKEEAVIIAERPVLGVWGKGYKLHDLNRVAYSSDEHTVFNSREAIGKTQKLIDSLQTTP